MLSVCQTGTAQYGHMPSGRYHEGYRAWGSEKSRLGPPSNWRAIFFEDRPTLQWGLITGVGDGARAGYKANYRNKLNAFLQEDGKNPQEQAVWSSLKGKYEQVLFREKPHSTAICCKHQAPAIIHLVDSARYRYRTRRTHRTVSVNRKFHLSDAAICLTRVNSTIFSGRVVVISSPSL